MKKNYFQIIVFSFLILVLVTTSLSLYNFYFKAMPLTAEDLAFDEQEATIRAINKIVPAVVSIVVYDYEDFIAFDSPSGLKEVQKYRKLMTKGTGFLISKDGYIVTNKHVAGAADKETGEWKVTLNSGKEYFAQMVGKDPLNDLAIIKIFDDNLPFVELGDSANLKMGTTVIAIGNTLGRYRNSASKGIVSGLGRSLVAQDQHAGAQSLDNVIQTDANINQGNSGGPLIDLLGNVVGINVALEASGYSVGFAIPINDARPVINSIKESGIIVRPRIGIRYSMITPEIEEVYKLPRSSGALIDPGTTELPAIVPGSPADRAGLSSGDIIFEINAIKIEGENTLVSVVQQYKPGDRIGLKILRDGKEIIIELVLDSFYD